MKKVYGKLFGDKGHIVNKKVFDTLFLRGIHLVTKLRRNMRLKMVTPLRDALLLRKRAISETIIDQLKNISQIEHTRHRSFTNFFVNILGGLCAYQFKESKPSVLNGPCRYKTTISDVSLNRTQVILITEK